jgi:hypothetical protein
MAKYLGHFEQRSAAWHYSRLGIPTASEMDRIITPTGKPCRADTTQKYLNRLLAEWVLGEPIISDYESEWMQHGRDHEDAAVKAFEFQTGLSTCEIGFVTLDDGMAGASPDRLVEDMGTLEIKAPAPQTHVAYMLHTNVADDYKVQNQAQMWICEREKSWVSSYHPKLPPVILEIPRDDKFIALLSSAVRGFVDVMLERRLELEQRFGPFTRPEPPQPKQKPDCGPFGISEADVDAILAGDF